MVIETVAKVGVIVVSTINVALWALAAVRRIRELTGLRLPAAKRLVDLLQR